ncbi:MAG: CDP-alcohol phosphatidyltransferase family protein [Lachnospiraceae bacterium]|nr:CDP-alcohol phosphatidyltransferase family protein [Lachnospiraceae bacterium]
MEEKKTPEEKKDTTPVSPYENRIITIPNILSIFRILLLPLFVYLYLHAETTWEFLRAAIVLAVSALTDLADGKIARRFNMISKLGKILDPIADKLTHITIAFCLCWQIPQMIYVFVLLLVKELSMMFMALYGTFRKNKKIWDSAQWYGKVCTTIVFVIFIVLALFPQIPTPVINTLLFICSFSLLGSLVMYIRMFWLLNSSKHNPD